MDALGIEAAVLSYPAGVPFRAPEHVCPVHGRISPENAQAHGTCHSGAVDANRRVARELNEYARKICEEGEGRGRFGWMACLPDWRDTEGKCAPNGEGDNVLGFDDM